MDVFHDGTVQTIAGKKQLPSGLILAVAKGHFDTGVNQQWLDHMEGMDLNNLQHSFCQSLQTGL